MKTGINLVGCDDSTYVEMDLADEEVALLRRISEAINKTSTYNCMPKMYVRDVNANEPYQEGQND